jgi:hypothetical protein
MLRLALAASLLVASACIAENGSDPDTGLSDPDFECSPITNPDDASLYLQETTPPDARDRTVTIGVSRVGGHCAEPDPASSVTIGGAPLGASTHAIQCASFAGPVPVEVSDRPLIEFRNAYGDLQVFIPGLFAARGATPVDHHFFALPAGQEIVLAWSHPEDLQRTVHAIATFGELEVPAMAMPDGVHLTMPADARGSAQLRVTLATGGSFGPAFSYDVKQRVEYQVTIAE